MCGVSGPKEAWAARARPEVPSRDVLSLTAGCDLQPGQMCCSWELGCRGGRLRLHPRVGLQVLSPRPDVTGTGLTLLRPPMFKAIGEQAEEPAWGWQRLAGSVSGSPERLQLPNRQ